MMANYKVCKSSFSNLSREAEAAAGRFGGISRTHPI